MKQYRGYIISYIILICSCVLIATQNAHAGKSEIINKDGFYIVDGVLEKYTGEIAPGKEIVLPKEVKTIGTEAFSANNYDVNIQGLIMTEYRTYYMKLTIPKDVKLEIGAFRDCISLDIYYGEGIKKLDLSSAVNRTTSCCKVHLPDSVRELEEYALSCNTPENVKVYLNSGIKKIGYDALSNVILDYELPKSLETIGDKALSGSCFVDKNIECYEDIFDSSGMLKSESVKIPKLPGGLKKIGDFAFRNPYLPDEGFIKIPASVNYIGRGAFGYNPEQDCYYSYKVAKKNKVYSSDKNGWLYSKDKKTLYKATINNEKNVIPKTVRNVEFLSLQRVGYATRDRGNIPNCNIYMQKKLERISQYACDHMYAHTVYFRGKKAPSLIKFKGDDAFEYRRNKIYYYGYISVPKSGKSKYIKKLKLSNVPDKILTH